jgi:AraC-like DNA-binding protein
MYSPVQDGIANRTTAVRYVEAPPPAPLSELVHCFWELRTLEVLQEDLLYHALPDGCVNLLFNQVDVRVAGVTALQTTSTVLNLGRSFHYVGIQLLPGVWQGRRDELKDRYVGEPYGGSLPLLSTNERLAGLGFLGMIGIMCELVEWCVQNRYVVPNVLTARILSRLDRIRSVADMATAVGLSTRQLQRALKQSTGFSPHDLLKVLRVQQSFRQHHLDLYADQSHFIHAFRGATGFTPLRYRKRYDV